jgi:hypothetical protein
MTPVGQGFRMQLQTRRLMRRHGIEPDIVLIPMTEPTELPQILEGLAATTQVDLQRNRFRPYAFVWSPDVRSVRLLFKHKAAEVAGTIDHLAYDDAGQLLIRCTVTHPEARRCNAFSVGASIIEYSIEDADNPDCFHALIRQARVDEVSLTPIPSQIGALVTKRHDVSARAAFYENAQRSVQKVGEMLAVLQTLQQERRA